MLHNTTTASSIHFPHFPEEILTYILRTATQSTYQILSLVLKLEDGQVENCLLQTKTLSFSLFYFIK